MAGYSEAQKNFVFEQWYKTGQPSLNSLYIILRNQLKAGDLPMTRVPTKPTLAVWQDKDNWLGRAKKRNAIVASSLNEDAVEFRNEMYAKLKKLTQVKIKAQLDIIESAKLDELTPQEARKLLEQAGLLSKDGINDFKNAMLIAGYDQEDVNNPLSELFVSIEKALGPDTSGELKMALMARIDNKTKVIEGNTS